jgi:hypothetical protein
MHTYRNTEASLDGSLWTVGHYEMMGYDTSSSDYRWRPMKDFSTEAEAAAYVSYLNGGVKP